MSYYIGLSILSNEDNKKIQTRIEARRILSLFENRHVTENDIAKETQGRPFFPNGDVDFNISHSGNIIAVSYVKGGCRASGKGLRVGCDIERIRHRAKAAQIAQDYFSPEENKYLFAEGSEGKFNDTRFYEIWTLKESYLKLRGLSVFDMKQAPSFINEQSLSANFAAYETALRPLSFRLFELSNENWGRCIFSTVIEGEPSGEAVLQPEIRWFSSASLTIDRIIDMN